MYFKYTKYIPIVFQLQNTNYFCQGHNASFTQKCPVSIASYYLGSLDQDNMRQYLVSGYRSLHFSNQWFSCPWAGSYKTCHRSFSLFTPAE